VAAPCFEQYTVLNPLDSRWSQVEQCFYLLGVKFLNDVALGDLEGFLAKIEFPYLLSGDFDGDFDILGVLMEFNLGGYFF
jgi:hypothetical protein